MALLIQAVTLLLVAAVTVKGNGGGYSYPAPNGGGLDEGGKPEPYSFSYEVKDAASGNDYSHKADSDGKKVTGEYMVLLPDTRRQKVKYTADENGYVADVQYEGEAVMGPAGGSGGGRGSGGGAGGYPSGGPTGARLPTPGGSYLPPGK